MPNILETQVWKNIINAIIKLISRVAQLVFSVAAHESGGTQYLYYAEIDDSMQVNEGGGNVDEGEYITKVEPLVSSVDHEHRMHY